MINLRDITGRISMISYTGNLDVPVTSVTADSRNVAPGSLFIAVGGTKTDGHKYLAQAINDGASSIICEKAPDNVPEGVTTILVKDSAEVLGFVAADFYGNPSASLRLTGVTGTNGKTTIATLLYKLHMSLGYKCGLLSTVCNYIFDRQLEATHTTPDPVTLNRLLAEMVDSGCEYVFMEVSSHAIDQKRIAGLTFTGGVFTNLTHDHLDYHLTFANYLTAKKRFFDALEPEAFALVNCDDKNGLVMLQNCSAKKYTYSLTKMADFRSSITEQRPDGMTLKISGREVWTNFIGEFNAYNLLAVFAAARLLGSDQEEVLTGMSALIPVSGRLEIIRSAGGKTGIVDYAHTPDALKNVTETINRLRQGAVKLISVVGAGGDRDKTKRPLMAAIAAAGSDKVILTSDNPRTEDPEKILDDMEAGLDAVLRRKMVRISDRRSAIRTAVMLAAPGDMILVAGKGHETYQEVNGIRHHFDDREELIIAFSDDKE
jgi:UDP-N-acetylmuramoyl-L-alanyl-D-glutamate--2,6-diaminopimelate ligase